MGRGSPVQVYHYWKHDLEHVRPRSKMGKKPKTKRKDIIELSVLIQTWGKSGVLVYFWTKNGHSGHILWGMDFILSSKKYKNGQSQNSILPR